MMSMTRTRWPSMHARPPQMPGVFTICCITSLVFDFRLRKLNRYNVTSLDKQSAHRFVAVDALDGLAEQGGDGEDFDFRQHRLWAERDRVGDRHGRDRGLFEPFDGRADEQAVSRRDV